MLRYPLRYLRWQAWGLWHWAGSGGVLGRAWARLVAGDAAVLCVAGVALGDIHLRFAVAGVALGDFLLRFAWQAWDNVRLET